MNIYTIGFAGKSAEYFFTMLRHAKVKKIYDIRLNNSSQLSGFAKKNDLSFFLKEICGIEYRHLPNLAPTEEILKAYKKGSITWGEYEEKFNKILQERKIERLFRVDQLEDVCFLCSENIPEHCHRRLVVEYLKNKLPYNFEIKHLV